MSVVEPVSFRFPPGLKNRLASAASDNHRSLNQEVVSRLERSLFGSDTLSDTAPRTVRATEILPARVPAELAGVPAPTGSDPILPPAKPTPAQVAESVPGVQTGASLSAGRDTKGAPTGFCVHRVKLDSYCKRCAP